MDFLTNSDKQMDGRTDIGVEMLSHLKIPIPAELQTNSLCLVTRGNTSLQPGTSPQEDTTGHKQQEARETRTKFPFQAFLKQEIIQYPQFSNICIIDKGYHKEKSKE